MTLLEEIQRLSVGRERFQPKLREHGVIRAGDICLARTADGRSAERLLLVLEVTDRYVSACLVSNEVYMATDHDVVLRYEHTGMPFDVIAELDITGDFLPGRIGEELFGRVTSELLVRGLYRMSAFDPEAVRASLRGLPVRGPRDRRWKFKEDELQQLHKIGVMGENDL